MIPFEKIFDDTQKIRNGTQHDGQNGFVNILQTSKIMKMDD